MKRKKLFKCDQSFSQKSIHDSNKSFKCDICDRTFSQKANLKVHIAEIH